MSMEKDEVSPSNSRISFVNLFASVSKSEYTGIISILSNFSNTSFLLVPLVCNTYSKRSNDDATLIFWALPSGIKKYPRRKIRYSVFIFTVFYFNYLSSFGNREKPDVFIHSFLTYPKQKQV